MRNNRFIYITLMTMLGLTSETIEAQEMTLSAPRLVVHITIDQLRTDYLEAFAPLYGENGFKKLLSQGCVYTNASYPLARIDRASAIATLMTGVTPFYHGIVAEKWLDKETLRPVYCVNEESQTSPANLATSTLPDELKVATEGKAFVFSIASTRDAAVLGAGHAADGAYWIDDATGRWTTSEYYSNKLPNWASGNNEASPLSEIIKKTVWEPVSEQSGSYNFYQHIGNQKAFRHKFKGYSQISLFKTSGLVNEHITELAKRCMKDTALGTDRITDMLIITYYAGAFNHKAMSECQLELQDTYVRLDMELGKLIDYIQTHLGADNVLFVITSTGYCEPESANYEKYRVPTGTFYINRAASLLNMYFGAIWGQGRWVETCFGNQIFLNYKLLESKRVSMTDATSRAQEFLSQIAGVRNIYTSQQLIAGNNQEFTKVRNSFASAHSGDIIIETAPGWRLLNEDTQETELSNASFTQFPIIIYGAQTKPASIADKVTVDRIAPTIAKAIRIRAPNACSQEPLF